MTVYFNVNGAGFKGARVPAAEAGLIGYWAEGKPWKPDAESVRAILPHRWRKAFDRAGPTFWFDKHDNTRPAHCALHDRRGRYLTTVYANGGVDSHA